MLEIAANSGATLDLGSLPASARAENHRFVARTVGEWASGTNRFDRPGERFLLARAAAVTVGMCGLNIDPFAGDPTIGRIRHLYVAPEHRRRGIGRRLVADCLDAAKPTFVRVRLRTFDPDAAAFYLALGFAAVDEEDATHSRDIY
ncbi:MAG: GNAT family N-acetyltransferase [Acidimicrobiia bacterium]|nr:GNAT family N-acetyltransferase [Acidimicrobiia bacterium]